MPLCSPPTLPRRVHSCPLVFPVVHSPFHQRATLAARRLVPRVVLLCAAFAACAAVCGRARADSTEPPVAVRLTWGGGKAVAWSGSIQLTDGESAAGELDWRMLSAEPDATATMHAEARTIFLHEPRGLDLNGVEVRVSDWRRARLSVQLAPAGGQAKPVQFDVAVADLIATPVQKALDADGNRITIKRATGDELRVMLDADSSTVRRPGETVRLTVHPLLPRAGASASGPELRLRLKRSADGAELHSQTAVLEPTVLDAVEADGPAPQAYVPVTLAVPLPQQEGAYDIELEAVERNGLRWSRSVASRTVQVVAVADAVADAPAGGDWRVLYELDPGSPKLLERLRRLPGMGMPSISMPGVSMPKMPLPSFAMPKMPLPNVSVPKLPSVNSMVPRLTGLLSVGHSTLETHPLGPMLRLPPTAADKPAWEGIGLAGTEPGLPHLVEIEYPLDQEAVVGLVVLEQPAADVRATGGGGFDVRRHPVMVEAENVRPKLGTHRFVFWPHTRTPLLLISNLSTRSAATFGRVRVLAGPTRVAAQPRVPSPGTSRRILMHLPTADFTAFGAADRAVHDAGRPVADWDSFLGGVRRSAEWAAAQGAAGAVVGVYADGAATWPSQLTHGATRWDSGGSFDGTIDPLPKDLLELICRIYARERLRLVPAIVCNGAVPELEALARRETEEVGVLCLGRDGRPPAADQGGRYNILDPRVQNAVERLVCELADRTKAAPAVDGVAVMLPHDGWLHVPGVAWGLDDVTFARFIAAAGAGAEPLARPVLTAAGTDGRRFAGRAALVEGPLREPWLAWREGVLAAFYGRLADAINARKAGWNLYVAPTTLFVKGELAGRFRPSLQATPPDADVLRSIALDPGLLTAHDRIVYVSPHVHAAADDVVERGVVQQANQSLTLLRGAAQAARRGAVFVEQPLDLDLKPFLPHSPFAAAKAGPVPATVTAVGAAARRALAESVVASDVEVVFDMGLVHRRVDDDDISRQRSLEILPTARLELVEKTPAPLIVRTRVGESGTWVSLVNACGVPCRAIVDCDQPPAGAVDAVTKAALPVGPAGEVSADLAAWESKTLVLDGQRRVVATRVSFEPGLQERLQLRLADLEKRRSSLEMAVPLAVLDNPHFELPELGGMVAGWELLEPQRGTLALVAGKPSTGSRGARFASANGLATLRSNPFQPPATGRISIAVWVRNPGDAPQPPLRIALEGVENDREYYRFAAVGRGDGAMPLSTEWSQFVLQVDDLPTQGIESLRVRLDLLGPGSVDLDDVRVFDLAFDESQRVQLSKLLAVAEQRLAAGDPGGCLIQLDGYWPGFLTAFVSNSGQAVAVHSGEAAGSDPKAAPPTRAGVMDRMRRWWQ